MTHEFNFKQSVPLHAALNIFKKAAEKNGLEAKITFLKRKFGGKGVPESIAKAFREMHENCSTAIIELKKNIFTIADINMTGMIIEPGAEHSVKIATLYPRETFQKNYFDEYQKEVESLIGEYAANN